MLQRLRLYNFKSFHSADISFSEFNVLIGANASGKTNFTQALQFLGTLAGFGFDNAYALQGSEFLFNQRLSSDEHSVITITIAGDFTVPLQEQEYHISEIEYEISLRRTESSEQRKGFIHIGERFKALTQPSAAINNDQLMSQQLELLVTLGQANEIIYTFLDPNTHNSVKQFEIQTASIPNDNALIIERDYLLAPYVRSFLSSFGFYDFQPSVMKNETRFANYKYLLKDGSNLARVLLDIMRDNGKRESFLNIVNDTLPFIETLDIDRISDNLLVLSANEQYHSSTLHDRYALPAAFFSDGTIHILGLIAALFFENRLTIIIEDPDKYVHPALLPKIIALCKEAAKGRTVIITTHNPLCVKESGIESLLFVTRDKNGFSTISKPSDSASVQTFVRNEIGVDEMFIDNFYGG
jgi:predicted ATPase